MSEKLLNESTIRRFMTLASIDAFSNSFINETGATYQRDEEELDEPGLEEPDLGEEPGMGEEPDLGMPEEPGGLTPEEPATAATVSDVVDAIVGAVQQTVPELEINMAGGEEMPMPDEAPEDLDPLPEMGGEEDLGEVDIVDDEAIQESVYRKVLAHLVNKR